MRTSCLMFLALMMANSTFAQEQTKPAAEFFGIRGIWSTKHPPPIPFAAGPRLALNIDLSQPAPAICSVPLLEAQIPKDVHFTIIQVHPGTDTHDPMPQVKDPAPPCERSSLH